MIYILYIIYILIHIFNVFIHSYIHVKGNLQLLLGQSSTPYLAPQVLPERLAGPHGASAFAHPSAAGAGRYATSDVGAAGVRSGE